MDKYLKKVGYEKSLLHPKNEEKKRLKLNNEHKQSFPAIIF